MGGSNFTREKIQWLHDTATEFASTKMKMTMDPDEVLALTSALMAAMDSEPVSEVLSSRPGNDTSTIDRALPFGTQLYLHAQPAPEYPEVLPCPVFLEPGLRFGKGVKTRLVLDAIQRRAEYYAELEAMTPEERAEHDAGIEEFKAMLPQPSPVVPDGYVMLPKVPTQAHLESIAMRYRHDFFLLEGTPRDSALATARQMYEECSGQGFYSLPPSHQAPVKQPSSKPKSEHLQRAEKLAEDAAALVERVQWKDLRATVRAEHAEWAQATFGNTGPVGPLKHLSAEALEAAAAPHDLSEWADMQFLFWDAQRKAGISDEQITQAMVEKLEVNKARQWPEPKDGEPRFHIK